MYAHTHILGMLSAHFSIHLLYVNAYNVGMYVPSYILTYIHMYVFKYIYIFIYLLHNIDFGSGIKPIQ